MLRTSEPGPSHPPWFIARAVVDSLFLDLLCGGEHGPEAGHSQRSLLLRPGSSLIPAEGGQVLRAEGLPVRPVQVVHHLFTLQTNIFKSASHVRKQLTQNLSPVISSALSADGLFQVCQHSE